MKFQTEVIFHNMDRIDWIDELIRKKSAKLQQYDHSITNCRVTVSVPHKHHHKGNICRVTIQISVPGKEIYAKGAVAEHALNEDIYLALKDAFAAATRELEDHINRRRDLKRTPHKNNIGQNVMIL